jgi:uncharacterized protein (TIGR03663 family)
MSKAAFWLLFGGALAIAVVFRVTGLDVRPMHHDEANQAVKFGTLLETGDYSYDPADHHGPTLYYLTLPAAWIRGQRALASLDELTIRIVPALFGAATILLFLLLVGRIGSTAVAAAALLAAVSPAFTYYSRFFIQEPLFVFFVLGFLIALGGYAVSPRAAPAVWAGILAGLAFSTKETALIVLPAAVAAWLVAWRVSGMAGEKTRRKAAAVQATSAGTRGESAATLPSVEGAPAPVERLSGGSTAARRSHALMAIAAALVVPLLFFSSFFRNPSGILDSVRALTIYAGRGMDAAVHVQPWDYYFRILAFSSSGGLFWTESLILVLAVAGVWVAFRNWRTEFWPLYIALYTLTAALGFSLIPYKTPWNLLPFHVGLVLLAGIGVAAIVNRLRPRALGVLLLLLFLAASWQLAAQSWRANFRYPADPRNPYVYAHTSTDFLRMVNRISSLAAIHPDGNGMPVKVIAGPYEQWPLPWYLRGMERVGYWPTTEQADVPGGAAVIVASLENADEVDAALGDSYVSEFYGLRPGVLLLVYIERGLWDQFSNGVGSRLEIAGRFLTGL